MIHRPKPPAPPGSSGLRAGLSLVEFLMAACILGVGLLGLAAMQAATARAQGGAGSRLTAAILAGDALEQILAEAGPASRNRAPGALKYTGPGAGPWVERFGRDGQPAEDRAAFYTVTVTRSAPGAVPAAWAFRAAVTWPERPVPGRFSLARLVAR